MESKFENMKRADLQKCAKKAGIRANMKTEGLIKALVVYHSRLNPADEEMIMTQGNVVEKNVPAPPSDKIESEIELTNETKPQRVRKWRGRGRRKTENKPEPELFLQINSSELTPDVTDMAPKSDVDTIKDDTVKTGRRGQRLRRKHSLVVKTPLEVKTPKSAQKRSHSDIEDETELPPAKQQRVSSSQNVKKIEPVPPTRKSTRKRTFSMSPKSEEKRNQEVTRVDGGDKRNSRKPKKNVPPMKKTGIPLPKVKASSEIVTPGKSLNFKKVHKAQFEKLESIDDYLERKRKRIEALTFRKAPSCSKKTPKRTPKRTQDSVTPKGCKPTTKRTSFFSPKPSKQTSKTVTFHASRLKTPAQPSTFVFGKASTEKRIATPGARKSIAVMRGSASRKSLSASNTTPFKFMDTSVNTPSNQKKFDLKASLDKHLPYKPYTGKLKPLSEIQPIKPQPVSHITKAKQNLKKPKISNRQERQRAATKHRAQSRKDNMMTRRGLSVV